MQIATRNNVFVIDIVSLGGERNLWQELSRSVFNNCDILKLGTVFTLVFWFCLIKFMSRFWNV